jgi:hypothetical protein
MCAAGSRDDFHIRLYLFLCRAALLSLQKVGRELGIKFQIVTHGTNTPWFYPLLEVLDDTSNEDEDKKPISIVLTHFKASTNEMQFKSGDEIINVDSLVHVDLLQPQPLSSSIVNDPSFPVRPGFMIPLDSQTVLMVRLFFAFSFSCSFQYLIRSCFSSRLWS